MLRDCCPSWTRNPSLNKVECGMPEIHPYFTIYNFQHHVHRQSLELTRTRTHTPSTFVHLELLGLLSESVGVCVCKYLYIIFVSVCEAVGPVLSVSSTAGLSLLLSTSLCVCVCVYNCEVHCSVSSPLLSSNPTHLCTSLFQSNPILSSPLHSV